jgi:hypothetical protein
MVAVPFEEMAPPARPAVVFKKLLDATRRLSEAEKRAPPLPRRADVRVKVDADTESMPAE